MKHTGRECEVTVETARGPVDPVETALTVIGGKWKPLVIWYLQERTLRFTELAVQIPKVTPRMLTKQLRELETAGLITRMVFAEVPLRVEYSLTAQGRAAIPVLEALYVWGTGYLAGPEKTLPAGIDSAGKKRKNEKLHKKKKH